MRGLAISGFNQQDLAETRRKCSAADMVWVPRKPHKGEIKLYIYIHPCMSSQGNETSKRVVVRKMVA